MSITKAPARNNRVEANSFALCHLWYLFFQILYLLLHSYLSLSHRLDIFQDSRIEFYGNCIFPEGRIYLRTKQCLFYVMDLSASQCKHLINNLCRTRGMVRV